MNRSIRFTAILVLIMAFAPMVQAQDSGTTYYVSSNQTVNARLCPQLACEVAVTFAPGDALTVVDTVSGDTVFGSDLWHNVVYNGTDVYVHSALLATHLPTTSERASPAAAVDNDGWVEYTAAGVSIKVPSGWEDTSASAETMMALGLDFLAERNPDLEDLQVFQPAFESLMTIDVTDPVSLATIMVVAEYTGFDMPVLTVQPFLEDQFESFGFEIVSNQIVEIPAGEAIRIRYRFAMELGRTTPYDEELYTYFVSTDRTSYTITIGARQAIFADWLPTFDEIINSFEIRSTEAARKIILRQAGTAHLGENTGEVTPGRFQLWTFDGEVGDVVNIRATAAMRLPEGPDTHLIVRGPNGRVIAENDDSGLFGLNTNARIWRLELPETGTYEIEVHAYLGFTNGAYSLAIETGEGQPTPEPQGQASQLSL